jgi:hypothetical protein
MKIVRMSIHTNKALGSKNEKCWDETRKLRVAEAQAILYACRIVFSYCVMEILKKAML